MCEELSFVLIKKYNFWTVSTAIPPTKQIIGYTGNKNRSSCNQNMTIDIVMCFHGLNY